MAQTKRMMLGVVAALAVMAAPFTGAQAQAADQVGDAYEITLQSVSESRGEGSSGSSRSGYALVERVIAVRDGGVELEFDLPEGTSAESRAQNWQFPARVFKPQGGALQLLNAPELQVRVRAWLASAQIPEDACGRWVFTWTSIKIECDPQSVLSTLEAFDLRPGDTSDSVEQIDPEAVRRERAEADVAVAQMMGEQPLAFEAALQARAAEQYSGAVTSRYETDAAGWVTRRVVMSELEITQADGSIERTTRTTTIERQRIAP